MVPLVAFGVAGRLIARFGAAVVLSLGCVTFAAGVAWWALAAGIEPNYPTGILGGMLLTGAGVGLTMPTVLATASASLPPQSFSTGSGVINMIRQTGMALGVAVLVAVLGTSTGRGQAVLTAFQHGWWVIAALSLASVIPAVVLLRRGRQPATATPPA
jgi:MFS family permease